jgi:hypothetical protein
MKVLGGLFGLLFLAGLFLVLRRAGAEGGRTEAAAGAGLIAIAVFGWGAQLVVEVLDNLMRACKRKKP